MLAGARVFILVLYTLIGLSFFATTGALIWEYRNTDWFSLATFYSHLFIFFPIFGTAALVAFFKPSAIFVDMYWRYIPGGRVRFVIGLVLVAAVSWGVAQVLLSGPQRSLFEIPPETLMGDRGDPAGCDGTAGPCVRLPILSALHNVRQVSQSRIGLGDLARNCSPDPLVEVLEDKAPRRYCFVSTASTATPILTTDSECCRAQRAFMQAVNGTDTKERSLTSKVHSWLLPLKVFFLLTLLVIGVMLAARRRRLETHYGELMGDVEKGVLAGAFVMLFFPVMNHAFLQSAAMLDVAGQSNSYRSPAPFFSFVFGGTAFTFRVVIVWPGRTVTVTWARSTLNSGAGLPLRSSSRRAVGIPAPKRCTNPSTRRASARFGLR